MKTSSFKKDCKDCTNSSCIRGFMCTCHYRYTTEGYIHEVGQDVHRKTAEKCEHYHEDSTEQLQLFIM